MEDTTAFMGEDLEVSFLKSSAPNSLLFAFNPLASSSEI